LLFEQFELEVQVLVVHTLLPLQLPPDAHCELLVQWPARHVWEAPSVWHAWGVWPSPHCELVVQELPSQTVSLVVAPLSHDEAARASPLVAQTLLLLPVHELLSHWLLLLQEVPSVLQWPATAPEQVPLSQALLLVQLAPLVSQVPPEVTVHTLVSQLVVWLVVVQLTPELEQVPAVAPVPWPQVAPVLQSESAWQLLPAGQVPPLQLPLSQFELLVHAAPLSEQVPAVASVPCPQVAAVLQSESAWQLLPAGQVPPEQELLSHWLLAVQLVPLLEQVPVLPQVAPVSQSASDVQVLFPGQVPPVHDPLSHWLLAVQLAPVVLQYLLQVPLSQLLPVLQVA
jgi:hypothetical protein